MRLNRLNTHDWRSYYREELTKMLRSCSILVEKAVVAVKAVYCIPVDNVRVYCPHTTVGMYSRVVVLDDFSGALELMEFGKAEGRQLIYNLHRWVLYTSASEE
ncbi:hypothetical protein NPIL_257131 [Nephila pilipes]|uniref:Uncharacterized protein n=1 Tax=Nephila pilipes TaxID=299642 RepID=A0A8X6NGC1_NEPPI|nr:hypothetical protein NPIL_257131 [Nephila pilipes]